MTTYLTVSAVRIQDWLTRTPKLRYLKGASAALQQHTGRLAIEELVGRRATWCGEAGEVSGVVALEVPAFKDAASVSERVAGYLRAQLPAVELEAWWTEGTDHVTAYNRWSTETQTGSWTDLVGRRVYLPIGLDSPPAQTCSGCRREAVDTLAGLPNARHGRDSDSTDLLGPDCVTRRDCEEPAWHSAGVDGRLAYDFEELALRGGVDPRDVRRDEPIGRVGSNNHLATVYADGNSVGSFMRTLASTSDGMDRRVHEALGEVRREAVQILADGTDEAVRRAVAQISCPAQEVIPIIVHVLGGDDILASVPAPLAWRFVTALAEAFTDEIRKAFSESLPMEHFNAAVSAAGTENSKGLSTAVAKGVGSMSLGIGVLFGHQAHPFADAQWMAHGAMTAAKRAVGGRHSAVSWLDLTYEGKQAKGRVLATRDLASQLSGTLPTPLVMTLPASARSVLATVLIDVWGDVEDTDRVTQAGHQLRKWGKRTGNANLPGTLAATQDGAVHVEDLRCLRDLLSRARWWPQPVGAAK